VPLCGLITQVPPNLVSYSTVVAAYARVAQPDDAMRVLRRMCAHGISPDLVTYNAVLDAYARAGMLLQVHFHITSHHIT
jgi:pentatricopeptide repeat protein